MPVFRSGTGKAPEWCEVEDFEILQIPVDKTHTFRRRSEKEAYVIGRGVPVFVAGDYECKVPEGGSIHLPPSRADEVTARAWKFDALIVRILGHWKSVASSGVFELWNVDSPPTHGSPYDYAKTSSLDNHYHDYDEYWVFYEGGARVVVGGEFHDVGPGDCVVTPMGWHHDCISVKGDQRISVVWFAGTPQGKKRIGHLHEPVHGKPEPLIPLPVAGSSARGKGRRC